MDAGDRHHRPDRLRVRPRGEGPDPAVLPGDGAGAGWRVRGAGRLYRNRRTRLRARPRRGLPCSSKCARSRPAVHRSGGSDLPTYVMLTTLTPEGVQTLKNNPARINEVNREVEQLGASVKAQWAVLGQYDFVNVVEAPDEKTMARVSLELGSRGTARYESLAAIPIDEFIAAL